jgi:hypothetical protein
MAMSRTGMGRAWWRLNAFVGWVERSDTHHRRALVVMGIAALNPSYVLALKRAAQLLRHLQQGWRLLHHSLGMGHR